MFVDTSAAITAEPSEETAAREWDRLQRARAAIDEEERALIERTLAAHNGVVSHAARALGIARTTLASRLEPRRGNGVDRRMR
jgi:transcriptional regulator with GAF, ATPase, and Fis domain